MPLNYVFLSAEIVETKINVLGRVNQPGQFIVKQRDVTVLDALALAGGLNRIADDKKITLRSVNEAGEVVIREFSLKKLITGEQKNEVLDSGDMIYVPEMLL